MNVAIILKSPELNCKVLEKKVIFADAGYKFKELLKDKIVLGVVGDFDSLGGAPNGENIVKLEVEKNFTDGEKAVRFAKECGAEEITIYGAFGGKIEHVLGNIALLKIARNIGLKAKIVDENTTMQLVDGVSELKVKKGANVSLIPYGGNCTFIKSKGLYYPLDGLTLTPEDTRGISNVALEQDLTLEILSGQALAIY